MGKYAVLNGLTVENIIVTDDKEQSETDLHATLIEITPEMPIGVGYRLIDGVFVAPEPPVEVVEEV